MTSYELFVSLIFGAFIFSFGISGLRSNEQMRNLKVRLEQLGSGLKLDFPDEPSFLGGDRFWIGCEVLGGLICLGGVAWYLWSLLPQAPM